MTIRELQYKIQEAIDEYGVTDDAKVKVMRDGEGKFFIRAEYGCGHFALVDDVNKD